MYVILQLIALGLFLLIAVNIWKSLRREAPPLRRRPEGPTIDGVAEEMRSPAAAAARHLRDFENARAELKSRYPTVFAMLGGYLNNYTMADHGGVEGAVNEMIADWAPRRNEVLREITKLLAENETEEEARAIVAAACDADFSREGCRAWLTWLLSKFNAL